MNGAGFAAGYVGQAFNLDGSSQYVELPTAPASIRRPACRWRLGFARVDSGPMLPQLSRRRVRVGGRMMATLWKSPVPVACFSVSS